ncbi:hypothetical protein INT48_004519 [Thamnidium elegans]|uniref:alpha-L-fucosidase n=1 Tax=Thamnidium elegans TaxID=101142 RepID=A0A8H7T0F7_9FUNG|nr:hypothetical protein INT48_004519 [Thamnidium elegans]
MQLIGNKRVLLFILYLATAFISHHTIYAKSVPSSVLDTLYHTIDIDPWINNKGFGSTANFDDSGTYFDGNLDTSGLLIKYNTNHGTQKYDNIKSNGQMVPLKNSPLGAIYMLVSASHGPMTTSVNITYTDGSQDATVLSIPDWQDKFVNQMDRYQVLTYPTNIEGRQASIFSAPIFVNPFKIPAYLILPLASKEYKTMHVFAVTAYDSSNAITASVESTDEWINETDQVILIKIHNTSPFWIKDVTVKISSPDNVKTVKEGSLEAIAPGHVQMAQVIVRKTQRTQANVTVTLMYIEGGITTTKKTVALLALESTSGAYTPTTRSVQKHRPPTWLKQAKFGIFIHWGLFSVPSWAPVGKAYAEWYWWRMNHKDDAAFAYHRQTYGESFEYDNFLSEWQPTLFDPHAWLDLIDKSGAKYYVFTTKHHDGIALFDTNVTDRSTSHLLKPGRDFVQELLSVSEIAYPHLKRGLYFSLPEWYHPKYKDESLGWQGPPVNPYTGENVPYTGSKPIESFVNELQVPQFQELANTYSPDILWCDIGGIHNSTVWQSDYFNNALKKGKQVTVNDRCGSDSASDFTTVEYKAVTDTPSRFWEATRGIDPYSFGYNRETKPEDYTSTLELVRDLVDAVSRGGNFLLNIGPEASGFIPSTMSTPLLEIGQWLKLVHASIFDSVPYWITSNQGDLRFTANKNGKSIYIFSFTQTQEDILVTTPIPIQKGSHVLLMNDPKSKVYWKHDIKQGGIVLKLDWKAYNTSLIPVFEISMP